MRWWCASLLLLLGSPTWAQEQPLTRAEPVVRMVLQEANHEPYDGMVAVAAVALDRVTDRRWPSSENRVVRQPWQFTGMRIRLRDYPARDIAQARAAVEHARAGFRPCGPGILWYHATWLSPRPSWASAKLERCTIGQHIFYSDRKKVVRH